MAGTVTKDPARSADAVRLAQTPLACVFLGERLTMDFYARLGFRFLGLAASAPADVLAARRQEFRALLRVDPTRARLRAIPTLSDEYMDAGAVQSAVDRLENPRHRFLGELFWLHLPDAELTRIREAGGLGTEKAAQLLTPNGARGLDAVRRGHALAISLHCRALNEELDYFDRRDNPPSGLWENALQAWKKVHESDSFWEYMRARAAELDDPRLQKEDVDSARAHLPRLLMSFQELLAEGYAGAENFGDCTRHLKLILHSGFAAEDVRTAAWGAVRKAAGTRLEDLHRRTLQAVEGIQGKVDRKAFDSVAAPLVAEAREIHSLLTRRLEIPDELLEQSAFDPLADVLRTAVNTRVSYEGDNRERNILYSALLVKRLLALPLSSGLRRKFEHGLRDDNRQLYSRFGLNAEECPDATRCFFAEGAEADPEASLVVTIYRVTGREVQVNHAQGSAGISVSYETRRVLIPCSRLAAAAKKGRVEIETPESEYDEEQRRVVAELNERKARLAAEQARVEHQRDAALAQAARTSEAQLETVRRAGQPKNRAAREAIERENGAEAAQLAVEDEWLKAESAKVAAARAPALQAARDSAAAVARSLSGFGSYLPREGAVFVVAALGFWLASREPVVSFLGAAAVAAGLGALFRWAMREMAGRKMRQVEQLVEAEQASVSAQSEKRRARIRQAAAEKRRPSAQVLEATARAEEEASQAGKRQAEALRAECDAKIRSAADLFAPEAKWLRAKLMRTVTSRDLSKKTEFAAYQAAKRGGVSEGTKPNSFEMQMTSSEREMARLKLMLRR